MNMTNKMTNEEKLLTVVSVMPVLADFLEDLNDDKFFSTQVKIQAQNLIAQVNKKNCFPQAKTTKTN